LKREHSAGQALLIEALTKAALAPSPKKGCPTAKTLPCNREPPRASALSLGKLKWDFGSVIQGRRPQTILCEPLSASSDRRPAWRAYRGVHRQWNNHWR